MNIGIVTTWFERGAAYVSRIYKMLLEKEGHVVFVFARGGENIPGTVGAEWNGDKVTRSIRYMDSTIEKRKLFRWLEDNSIEILFFNEQKDFRPIIWVKERYPQIVVGSYVDYYTELTIPWFNLYDFIICNTKRHMQAMSNHSQKVYIRWGTNTKLFVPSNHENRELTFFHSAGMSSRKGTEDIIDAFIEGKIFTKSKLIIHTQIPIDRITKYEKKDLLKYNIEVIEKTVPEPGLYYLGDVYVYPARLDGLGLTMYEALSSGLPMITTDFPPMNEVGDESFVKRIKVKDYYCRGDAYYYPMVVCDRNDLIDKLRWYIDHPEEIKSQKKLARQFAEKYYDIFSRSSEISDVFVNAKSKALDNKLVNEVYREYYKTWSIANRILNCRRIYNMRHRKV